MLWRISCSNSAAGKPGSRSTSASSVSAGTSCARLVLRLALAPSSALAPTRHSVLSASKASLIWARVLPWVPMGSIAPTVPATARRPYRLSRLPKCRFSITSTVSPRVLLGSRATFRPEGRV